MLAAAPTTPPCFRRWRRSSSLHFGHKERKEYFVLQFRNACGRFGTAFLWGEKHTPPPYRDFAHNFAPFFGRCCPQKRFISLNFGAILNLAFLSVPAVPFGGIAGQINRKRRGYHEKTHREHDTGTQYDALHPSCIRICRCRGRAFFRGGGRDQQHHL